MMNRIYAIILSGFIISSAAIFLMAGCGVGGEEGAAKPLANATGKVIDQDSGAPIAYAKVELVGEKAYQDYTDSSGVFLFTAVEPGTYSLTITAVGYSQRKLYPITLGAGDNDLGTITLSSNPPPPPP